MLNAPQKVIPLPTGIIFNEECVKKILAGYDLGIINGTLLNNVMPRDQLCRLGVADAFDDVSQNGLFAEIVNIRTVRSVMLALQLNGATAFVRLRDVTDVPLRGGMCVIGEVNEYVRASAQLVLVQILTGEKSVEIALSVLRAHLPIDYPGGPEVLDKDIFEMTKTELYNLRMYTTSILNRQTIFEVYSVGETTPLDQTSRVDVIASVLWEFTK